MIDSMNGLNGNNGKDSYVPCPSCSELRTIQEIIESYTTFDDEAPSVTIDMLVSEVKMWRAKDSYERKLKSTLIASTIKKMGQQGFQIDGNQFNN